VSKVLKFQRVTTVAQNFFGTHDLYFPNRLI